MTSAFPDGLETSVAAVLTFARDYLTAEAQARQLFYHNLVHAEAVWRRSRQIFEAVRPYWDYPAAQLDRWARLLEVAAFTHDLVQVFLPDPPPNNPRRRQPGASETATIDLLVSFIQQINPTLAPAQDRFTAADQVLLAEVIHATTHSVDAQDQAAFQPALYRQPGLTPMARILALADMGTLAMEGIDAYNQEGSLVFLEENPDVVPVIAAPNPFLATTQTHLLSLRERLLQRARYQVAFARSRWRRLPQELNGLPAAALPTLQTQVFHHLTPETIAQIEATTPTADATDLKTLLMFFGFV